MPYRATALIHHTVAQLDTALDIGRGTTIDPFCCLQGQVTIGRHTRVWSHVVIGTDGEHKTAKPSGRIIIGNDVQIREFSVVHRGTGDRDTAIGDRCYLMHNAHISHDSVLAEDCTLSPSVTLGGHSRIHRGATLGIGSMTHQLSTVGAFAMIGMGSAVTRDVPPFALVVGNPARFVRWNTKAIEALDIAGPLADSAIYAAAMVEFEKDSRRQVMETP